MPVGFDEDSAYLGSLAQFLIRQTLVTSPELRDVRDMDRFWHETLLQLLRCRDLRLISVWHPSFLLILLERLRRDWLALIAELGPGYRSRTAELSALDPMNAGDVWPELRMISCWGDGLCPSPRLS